MLTLITNLDPTRTIGIRNAFIADTTRRHKNLAAAIKISIVDRDALGLGLQQDRQEQLVATPTGFREFAFRRDPEKVAGFMAWLKEQERKSVLEIIPGPLGVPEPYSTKYVRSSYQKGLDRSLRSLRAKGIEVPATIIPGAGGTAGIFHSPFHQDRSRMIYARTFTELQGVTASMDAQISEVLSSGLIEGIGPEEMARRINNRVDKIGLTRSKLIARTEVVETFNQAATAEFQRVENIIGEEILIQWQTSEDERVRGTHQARNGKIFTKEEFLQLIGEPNCRCTGLPVLESIDGEVKTSSASTFI